MLKIFKELFSLLSELLYPWKCPFCRRPSNKWICDSCRKKLVEVKEPKCVKCGKPVRKKEQEYCTACKNAKELPYERGISLWVHKPPISESIYRFKYHNCRLYADAYAKECARRFKGQIKKWNIQLIVPVPMYDKKRRRRGYNQAQVLAEKLGEELTIPVDSESVARVLPTTPQKLKGRQDRRKNLMDAFRMKKVLNGIENVLVVDDIYTTGATVEKVAECLKKAGAKHIWFFTISIGQDF